MPEIRQNLLLHFLNVTLFGLRGKTNSAISGGRRLTRICDAIVTGSGVGAGVAATKLTGCGREVLVLKAPEGKPSRDLLRQSSPYDTRFRGFVKHPD